MGGSGGILSPTLPQTAPPDPNQKPQTYQTNEDPTARQAGQNPSATVYTATRAPIPGIAGLLGQTTPVTRQQQNGETAAATQIVDQFNANDQQLAQWFGQPQITDFRFYVNPASSLTGAGAGHLPVQPGEPQHYEDNVTININTAPNAKLGGPNEATGLADAEAVESYEDRTGNWNAGLTNGEALSRALSFQMQPNLARDPGFGTDPMQSWWQNGHKDYINGNPDFNPNAPTNSAGLQYDGMGGTQTQSQASDRNESANGAGTLFLEYMHNNLGYSWNQIINAQGNTLGEKYQSLTGQSGQKGFQNFINALPTTKDKNGNTVLNLPPNGNPFQQPNPIDQITQGISNAWNAVKNFFSSWL